MAETQPIPTDPAAETVDSDISLAMKAAESGVEALIVADFPWAALPVVKQIIDGLIQYFGGKFSAVLQGEGTTLVVDTQIDSEESGMSQALANLLAAEKGGDPNAIKAAIQAYANAQSALVHFDGSSPPVQ